MACGIVPDQLGDHNISNAKVSFFGVGLNSQAFEHEAEVFYLICTSRHMKFSNNGPYF